jgi:hypothetical protein
MSTSEIAFISNILTSDVSNSEKKIAASGGSFGETPAEGFTTSGGAPAEGFALSEIERLREENAELIDYVDDLKMVIRMLESKLSIEMSSQI